MKNTRWVWILGCLAFVGSLSTKTNADDAVAVKQSVKAGDSIQLKSTITVAGADVTVEQNTKQAVTEVKANGDSVITVTLLGGKYTVNGTDNEIPAGPPTTLTENKFGRILTFKPANDDNPYLSATTLNLLALAETVILPEKPVKPGDSWTTTIDNPAEKDKKVTITTTFVGADKADGKPVWKLKQSLTADTDAGKMTSDGTATLDAASGQLQMAQIDIKGVPVKIGAPADWSVKIALVKPDAKKDARSRSL